MNQAENKISIIVPFRDDLAALTKCLSALQAQDYPGELEIVAVDNGSTTDLSGIHAAFPNVRWQSESKPGSYAARNTGIRLSTGEIIGFTDSDCVPEPAWIRRAVETLQSERATLVGGKIAFITPADRSLNACELFEQLFFGMTNQRNLVTKSNYAATANLVAQRSAFARVGQFDSDLKSSGDKEWGQRATAAGERLVYAEEAVVWHPRRSTFGVILKKTRRIVGGTMALMQKRQAGRRDIWRYIFRESVFNPKMHLYALFCARQQGALARVKLFAVIEAFSVIVFVEKIRVLAGGSPSRG
jgi:GT2 family glycosyltransferase